MWYISIISSFKNEGINRKSSHEKVFSRKIFFHMLNDDYEIQRGELQPEWCLPHGWSAVLQSSWEQ